MKASGANSWCSHYPEGEWQLVSGSCSRAMEARRPGCIKGESRFPFKLIAKEPPVPI